MSVTFCSKTDSNVFIRGVLIMAVIFLRLTVYLFVVGLHLWTQVIMGNYGGVVNDQVNGSPRMVTFKRKITGGSI